MDFLLDPYIIAVPDLDLPNGSVERYATALAAWTSESAKGHHKFWLSGWILGALYGAAQYPTPENLKRLSWENCIYSPYDLFRACERSLVAPPYIEDQVQDGRFLYDPEQAAVLPDEIESRLKPAVAEALRQTLVCLGIGKQVYDNPIARDMFFATAEIANTDGRIHLETEVNDIESSVAQNVTSEWMMVLSPLDLDAIEDLCSFWRETNRATQWAHRNLRRRRELDPHGDELPDFVVGAGFNEVSIQHYHYDSQPTILPAIFETIVKVLTGTLPRGPKNNHQLRISKKSTSPQRIRQADGALAWRAWVNKDNSGVRLHYWLTEDEKVEISRVGPHEDFSI